MTVANQLSFMLENDCPGQLIAGVDEVGRGPLAGDVVAAAVILSENHGLEGLDDSKKLSEKRRDILCGRIQETALAWAVGRASVAEIDSLNILHASLLAMRRAVESLSVPPGFVYVDGNRCPDWHYASRAVVKGDSRVEAIAAASIIAKVTRDRELVALDACYPGYGLADHKGYPTRKHMEALRELGPSSIHRRSFRPVAELEGR